MARDAIVSLVLRTQAGRWVWAAAAFLFPSLAAAEQGGAATAVLLYVAETAVAFLVLALRLQIAWRATRHDPVVHERLRRTRHGTVGVLAMVAIGLLWGVGLAGILAVLSDPRPAWASFAARSGPMLGMLLLAAAVDTVVAPVRSPAWLETGLAWQASRASIIVVSMLIGGPLALWLGAPALVWSFLGLRLVADLGGFRRSERERIRANLFDGPVLPDPRARDVAKAPPRFSPAHARHALDPSRLPD